MSRCYDLNISEMLDEIPTLAAGQILQDAKRLEGHYRALAARTHLPIDGVSREAHSTLQQRAAYGEIANWYSLVADEIGAAFESKTLEQG